MKNFKNILVTGGAGFIGGNLIRHFVKKYPDIHFYNLDNLTYASNLEYIEDLKELDNYTFIKDDITTDLTPYFLLGNIDCVIHLAAESHVDNSIENPDIFVKTNVNGTVNLLNTALKYWKGDFENKLFYHVSTDEVYGDAGVTGFFDEDSKYEPNSPYSSSKASSDHFVRSYGNTYGLPYIISNCSNNYGENQHVEKLIPKTITNALNIEKIPVYGEGLQIRDWLYVGDHVKAIEFLINNGSIGETYLIGGDNEMKNIDIVNVICDAVDDRYSVDINSKKLIRFVEDRAGHDFRYAIDASKIKKLGWSPETSFEEGIRKTIEYYD